MKKLIDKTIFSVVFFLCLSHLSYGNENKSISSSLNFLLSKIFSFENQSSYDQQPFNFDINNDQKINIEDLYLFLNLHSGAFYKSHCELCSENNAWFEVCLSSGEQGEFFDCAANEITRRNKCSNFIKKIKSECESPLWDMMWGALRCNENLSNYSPTHSWQCVFALLSSQGLKSFFDEHKENSCVSDFRNWDEFLECNSY